MNYQHIKLTLKRLSPILAVSFMIVSLVLGITLFTSNNHLIGDDQELINLINRVQPNEAVVSDEPSLQNALRLQQSLRNIASSVMNSVVNVRSSMELSMGDQQRNDEFFKFFFGEQNPFNVPRVQEAFGSGFIISENGYILTNFHVIQNATQITVDMLDKSHQYEAEVIGMDEKTDLALIKIDPEEPLTPIPFGDSEEVQIGDFAIAIGNPFGLTGSMSFGIVSAINREQVDPNAGFKNYIQTDAPINQGNSGGPLLNIQGQVIGVNAMIYSQTGGSVGIGFAIPINIAKYVVEELLTHGGVVQRGYLGVFIQDITDELASHFDIERDAGVFVESIIEDSPADKAGLEPGDIITHVDDVHVSTAAQLQREIGTHSANEVVTLQIIRNGVEHSKEVTLGLSPDAQEIAANTQQPRGTPDVEDAASESFLGLTVANIESTRYRRVIPTNINGVVITNIESGSAAAQSGLRAGDVIMKINYNSIGDLSAFEDYIDDHDNEDSYLLQVYREGKTFFVVLSEE